MLVFHRFSTGFSQAPVENYAISCGKLAFPVENLWKTSTGMWRVVILGKGILTSRSPFEPIKVKSPFSDRGRSRAIAGNGVNDELRFILHPPFIPQLNHFFTITPGHGSAELPLAGFLAAFKITVRTIAILTIFSKLMVEC